MKSRLALLSGLLLILLSWPALGGSAVYFHNRVLEGHWEGGEYYVAANQLSTYLDREEFAQVTLDASRQILRVGEQELAYNGRFVPMLALAKALGLRRIDSNGVVDFVRVGGSASEIAPQEFVSSPRRGEYEIAAKNMNQLLRTNFPLSEDAPRAARVAAIGQKVVKSSPLAAIPWKFLLVRVAEPNACCVGEGHVIVTTGLLDLGLTDDELAGVLGHEIAHGVRRHIFVRQEIMRQLQSLVKDYARLSAELQGTVNASLRAQVDDYERRRAFLQHRLDNDIFYSQVQEEEADVVGLRYAVLAGYSADGLGNGLKRLERFQVERFGTAVLQEGLSHPPVRKRLEILEKARRNGRF